MSVWRKPDELSAVLLAERLGRERCRIGQQSDGSWSGHSWTASFGQVYVTAVLLTILQLDNNTLPIYQK